MAGCPLDFNWCRRRASNSQGRKARRILVPTEINEKLVSFQTPDLKSIFTRVLSFTMDGKKLVVKHGNFREGESA